VVILSGISIDFGCVYSDNRVHGIFFMKDEHGNISIFDDTSESYDTWRITQKEVEDELYLCWKERIKQKRYTKEAYEFERELGTHLDAMAKAIVNRTWKPEGYYNFTVYHPQRIISAPYYKDRIVEEWITDKFVKPFLEPKLHPSNVACRKKNGPPAAHDRVVEILSRMYKKYGTDFYILQCDIQGYYDNLNHARIKEQFKGMPYLGYILFMNIIDDWKQTEGYAAQADPMGSYGVPKGNLPSQWIGLCYLNELDWIIAARQDNEGQCRYMDDFIIAFHLKSSCKDLKIKIERYFQERDMGIKLHPKKTKYFPITEGFTFCGWRYEFTENGHLKCLLRKERKKITKKRMKAMTEDYFLGNLTSFDVKQKLSGTYAFLKQGDTKQLRRYLTYKYLFTRDEELYKRSKSFMFRKKKQGGLNEEE
jgi:hypothetical protein